MCLQKGSGISLWSLRVSKVLIPDPIQVFINRNIYPECKEGFGVTEGNGGFETVLGSAVVPIESRAGLFVYSSGVTHACRNRLCIRKILKDPSDL